MRRADRCPAPASDAALELRMTGSKAAIVIRCREVYWRIGRMQATKPTYTLGGPEVTEDLLMSMKVAMCVVIVVAVISGRVAVQSAHFLRAKTVAAADGKPRMQVTRVYSGSDGQTHAEPMDVKLSAPNQLGMEQSEELKAETTNFARFPATFFEDWHCAHARRYVITLTGRGEAEIAGGRKIPMEPGRVVLFEDMTGRGHISRALTADWTAVFVQLTRNDEASRHSRYHSNMLSY